MPRTATIAERRQRACNTLLGKARKITHAQGIAAVHAMPSGRATAQP